MTFDAGVTVIGEDESAEPDKVLEAEYINVTVVVSPFARTEPFKVPVNPETVGLRVVAVGAALEVLKFNTNPGVVPRALSPTAWK
jgi:hypothetical protein